MRTIAAITAVAIAALAGPAHADSCRDLSDPKCKAELEPKCRKASEEMLAYMRATPPGDAESHRRRHAELLAKAEKALAYGRERGNDWCEAYRRIQDIVVNQ
ncbi:MAG: hypothetical protein IPH30_16495 [Betaproteobacteria bacterium]|nr:hypothetical protein [Betaproteobacteria bacterium]